MRTRFSIFCNYFGLFPTAQLWNACIHWKFQPIPPIGYNLIGLLFVMLQFWAFFFSLREKENLFAHVRRHYVLRRNYYHLTILLNMGAFLVLVWCEESSFMRGCDITIVLLLLGLGWLYERDFRQRLKHERKMWYTESVNYLLQQHPGLVNEITNTNTPEELQQLVDKIEKEKNESI